MLGVRTLDDGERPRRIDHTQRRATLHGIFQSTRQILMRARDVAGGIYRCTQLLQRHHFACSGKDIGRGRKSYIVEECIGIVLGSRQCTEMVGGSGTEVRTWRLAVDYFFEKNLRRRRTSFEKVVLREVVFILKSATIIQYTIKGRFMSR